MRGTQAGRSPCPGLPGMANMQMAPVPVPQQHLPQQPVQHYRQPTAITCESAWLCRLFC